MILPFGLSCDAGRAVFFGDIFQTTLSSPGDTSTLSTVLGVLDIKSDNGILCGIGVARFSASLVSMASIHVDAAGVVALYAKFCSLFMVTSDGLAEADNGVVVAFDDFSYARLKCP